MITFLHGKLVEALPTQVMVNVNGVGYEALIPLSSYDKLPAPGQEVKLLTHLVVREDAHMLYGFMSTAERDLFRLLINTVSGIGPEDRAECVKRDQRDGVSRRGGQRGPQVVVANLRRREEDGGAHRGRAQRQDWRSRRLGGLKRAARPLARGPEGERCRAGFDGAGLQAGRSA